MAVFACGNQCNHNCAGLFCNKFAVFINFCHCCVAIDFKSVFRPCCAVEPLDFRCQCCACNHNVAAVIICSFAQYNLCTVCHLCGFYCKNSFDIAVVSCCKCNFCSAFTVCINNVFAFVACFCDCGNRVIVCGNDDFVCVFAQAVEFSFYNCCNCAAVNIYIKGCDFFIFSVSYCYRVKALFCAEVDFRFCSKAPAEFCTHIRCVLHGFPLFFSAAEEYILQVECFCKLVACIGFYCCRNIYFFQVVTEHKCGVAQFFDTVWQNNFCQLFRAFEQCCTHFCSCGRHFDFCQAVHKCKCAVAVYFYRCCDFNCFNVCVIAECFISDFRDISADYNVCNAAVPGG